MSYLDLGLSGLGGPQAGPSISDASDVSLPVGRERPRQKVTVHPDRWPKKPRAKPKPRPKPKGKWVHPGVFPFPWLPKEKVWSGPGQPTTPQPRHKWLWLPGAGWVRLDGMGGLSGLSGGWDIFGKKAREKRKEKVQLSAQSFSEKMTLMRYEQEKSAVETFREKIVVKLGEVERVAGEAAMVIEQVRRMAEDPVIEGDPILEETDKHLADFEEGLVQIQSGTVVDTATFDTHRLAISYSDAQAALIGMTSLKTRSVGILEDLRRRIEQVAIDKERIKRLEREGVVLAEQEARRQEALRQEQELDQREEEAARQSAAQDALFKEYRRVTGELQKEKREVANLKRKIGQVLRSRESQVQRKLDAEARRAKFAAMRAGFPRRAPRVA